MGPDLLLSNGKAAFKWKSISVTNVSCYVLVVPDE